jgi:hypothetical protein
MPAIGNNPIATTPRAIRSAVHGPLDVYLDDFLSFGSGDPTDINYDWRPVLQAAYDQVANNIIATNNPGLNRGATFHIRGTNGISRVSGPVYMWNPGTWIDGEGLASYFQSGQLNGAMNCPIFMPGWRTPQSCGGQFLAHFASYRPDCFGKVDTSLASAPGQRLGFRSQGESFIQAWGTQFSHGGGSALFPGFNDCWEGVQTFCLEFFVEGFAAGGLLSLVGNATTLFGINDNTESAYPFWVFIAGDTPSQIFFYYATQSVPNGPASNHQLNIAQAVAGGPQRVTFQLDIRSGQGTLTGWVNGIQAGTVSVPSGVSLFENLDHPFLIGNGGSDGVWQGPFTDFALYGLSISKTLRYKVSTNGSVQTRASDNAPYSSITDQYRYGNNFTDVGDGGVTTGIVGYFRFTENPATLDMMMGITGGNGISTPAFLSHPLQHTGGLLYQGLSNMHLNTFHPYSAPVMFGQVLHIGFENLFCEGGLWGITSGNAGSTYTVHVNNCLLSGGDAAIFGLFVIFSISDTNINSAGKHTMLLSECDVYMSGFMFIAGATANCKTSVMRYLGGGSGGGDLVIRNIIQDVENPPFPSLAGIMIDRNAAGSQVILSDISCGDIAFVPTIILNEAAPDASLSYTTPNYIKIDRVSSSQQYQPCFVQVNGLGWTGTIDDLNFGQTQVLQCLNTFGVGTSVKITSLDYVAPPHGGTWYQGTTTLKVPAPADGLPTEWPEVKTGTMGSRSPAGWKGINAYQSTPQALAAVAMDHTIVETTAYGGSAFGWLSDHLTSDVLALLFGQTSGSGKPSTLQFFLTTTDATKWQSTNQFGSITEPAGSTGYTRGSLTNNLTSFPAASAGSKSNGAAITFGTLTAALTGIVGFGATDQSGTNLLFYVRFATPQNYAIGATPTIGIGALTFTQFPTSLPGYLTQFGWGKILDRYFGGVEITLPGTWYVGLNTAKATSPATAPTEVTGDGYARAPLANDTTHWGGRATLSYVMTCNLVSPTFPSPTGSGWGTIDGILVADAATAGDVWWVADAPNPVACPAGSPPTVGYQSIVLTM